MNKTYIYLKALMIGYMKPTKNMELIYIDFAMNGLIGTMIIMKYDLKDIRKMIVCSLVREVKVSRGYDLDITMDMNYEQFVSEMPL